MWPSKVAGLRGKKLAVVGRELVVHAFPLPQQEVAHHLVALGQRLGFQVVEGGFLLQEARVEGGNINAIQFGELVRLGFIVDAADPNRQSAHGPRFA